MNAQGMPAWLPLRAGRVMISAATAIARTALNGIFASFTFERTPETLGPKPRSREKAKHIRDALVRQAPPQNNWPTVEMIITALKAALVSAVCEQRAGANPSAVLRRQYR